MLEGEQLKPHFIGAVVLKQMDTETGTIERRTVVDGQQRLTTLQLLIDAVREVLDERDYVDQAKRLAKLVVNEEEFLYGNPDNAFKVWPTIADRIAFQHAMNKDLSATDHAKSLIVQAHNFFKAKAEQWFDRLPGESGSRSEAATALERTVRAALNLVVIDLGASDDPHVIFETLNARGTPLRQSDMVKNKIFHEAKAGESEGSSDSSQHSDLWPFDKEKTWWNKEVGRGFQRRPRIDLYINHWLTLRNRKETKAHNEFRAFEAYAKRQREAGEEIQDIAKDIGKISSIYLDVEEVRRPDIAKFLKRRNVMNLGTVTPLLLWLLSKDMPYETLARCLKALESFLVRRIVCGYSARSYGDFFVGLISKLDDAQANDAHRILALYLAEQTAQATVWPGNDEMLDRFLTAPLYLWLTRGRLRMVLTGIEEQLRTRKSEEQQAPDNLPIEHIMPISWQAYWPLPNADARAAERRERMIHTMGNLTLVNTSLNSTLKNAPWDRKKRTLADHSVLFLNKQLVNDGPQVWDEDAIEERARQLCEIAISVWPHHNDTEAA